MLAGGRITKTRKTDIAFKLRHELLRTSESSVHLVEWNFENDLFRTTTRFV